MQQVTFVDTSVFCNILPIPGFDQDRVAVLSELRARIDSELLILPVTTVIEAGNHVAQLPDGAVRRSTAQLFCEVLSLVVSDRSPWALNEFAWGADFLRRLVAGGGTGVDLVSHFMCQLGGGDLCLLTERDEYRERTRIPSVAIWSLDTTLASYA